MRTVGEFSSVQWFQYGLLEVQDPNNFGEVV